VRSGAIPAALLAAVAALADTAAAQPAATEVAPSPATPRQTARCAGLQDDAARLTCYDALFRATPQVAEASFGLERQETRPSESLETIASPIALLERLRDGTVRVTLANGQVWRQTDGSRQTLWRTGDRLLIERASLGSFLAAVEGSGRHVRVRRER
jgi:hypothetical protein